MLADPSLNSLAFRLVGDDKEDLMQEMALLIWEEQDDKIEKIANYFNFWCVRVMINITGKRGSFTKKYSKKYVNAEDYFFNQTMDYEDGIGSLQDNIEACLTEIYGVETNQNRYKRELFKLYLECGSLRKVEAEVDIPFVSVHNTVKEVKNKIKDKL